MPCRFSDEKCEDLPGFLPHLKRDYLGELKATTKVRFPFKNQYEFFRHLCRFARIIHSLESELYLADRIRMKGHVVIFQKEKGSADMSVDGFATEVKHISSYLSAEELRAHTALYKPPTANPIIDAYKLARDRGYITNILRKNAQLSILDISHTSSGLNLSIFGLVCGECASFDYQFEDAIKQAHMGEKVLLFFIVDTSRRAALRMSHWLFLYPTAEPAHPARICNDIRVLQRVWGKNLGAMARTDRTPRGAYGKMTQKERLEIST